MEDNRYPGFPVLKGLQQPLEFMGIQGRYIYWAAAAVGGAIAGFIIAYCIAGFVAGLVVLVLALAASAEGIDRNRHAEAHRSHKNDDIYCHNRLFVKVIEGRRTTLSACRR